MKAPRPKAPPAGAGRVNWEQLDLEEQISVVCGLFLGGLGPAALASWISEKYSTHFSREATNRLLRLAHKRRWFDYRPPLHLELATQLSDRYDWLRRTRVVHTSRFDDVGFRAATLLMELLEDLRRRGRTEVHVGFAGGHAMRILAQALADRIRLSESKKLPGTIVLHALVAGFDVFEPTTDPNTFFTLFRTSESDGVQFKHVGIHTPPVVTWAEIRRMRKREGIRESYQCARDIEIIVTSGSCWADPHCILRKYMEKSEKCLRQLEADGCAGDMLWLPLSLQGPLEKSTQRRAMTLLDLSDLHRFIAERKYVVLALGPCVYCGEPKGEVLKAILANQLITDLVVDSRTARQVLDTESKTPGT